MPPDILGCAVNAMDINQTRKVLNKYSLNKNYVKILREVA